MESKQGYANVAMGNGAIEVAESCPYEQDGTALDPSLVTLFLNEDNARKYYADSLADQQYEAERYSQTPTEQIVFNTRILRIHGVRVTVYAVTYARASWVNRRQRELEAR